MRCPCQDKPPEQRLGCIMCGGTGVASCCETERPTWAPRDADDQRQPFRSATDVQMPDAFDCPLIECNAVALCSEIGRCHALVTEDLIGHQFARGLATLHSILDKHGVPHGHQ